MENGKPKIMQDIPPQMNQNLQQAGQYLRGLQERSVGLIQRHNVTDGHEYTGLVRLYGLQESNALRNLPVNILCRRYVRAFYGRLQGQLLNTEI
jgi:hypothetical protein